MLSPSGERCRPARFATSASSLLSLLFLLLAAPAASAADITGQIVDASGRAVPRAHVRVVAGDGRESAAGFADDLGRFRLAAEPPCRVEVSLAGFETASVACAEGRALQVTLAVAPIRESVLVSATRTDAPLGQVGASATVLTAEDLERRQQPLVADVLNGTPGVMLLRSGGPGTVTSLFVRGGESDYNKILLDGVPLNEPGGTFYLSNLTTENLDRVEVVRGAFSSLFGSDAMASVVQLVTKRALPGERPQASVQVDGGSYGTLHSSAAVRGAAGRLDYSAAAARLDTDNRVPNNALENTTLSGTLGVKLSESTTLRTVMHAERAHVGTPGQTAFGRPDLDAFFERHDAVVSATLEQQLTPRIRQRAAYSLAGSNQQSTNLVADPPFTPRFGDRVGAFESSDFLNDTLNEYRRHHAGYQADVRLAQSSSRGDHTLTFVADWDGERATAIDRRSSARGKNGRDNFGAAVQDQILWRRLFVTVGGRVEKNESFGTAFTPRGSAVYVARQSSGPFGETRLTVSGGTGIKEPTLAESFSLSPYFRGNPDLDPERSRSVEAGVVQRLLGDRVKLQATWFHNTFTDVIQLVTTNPATFEGQYFNTGATRARGVELVGEAAPNAFVRLRGSYTFLDGRVTETRLPDDPVFGAGQRLFRRPMHSGSAGATITWRRVVADLDGIFIGEFVDSDFGTFTVPLTTNPGHQLWNARFSWRATRQLTGLVVIDNLMNEDYSEPFGYQPLLRSVRAGVRVQF